MQQEQFSLRHCLKEGTSPITSCQSSRGGAENPQVHSSTFMCLSVLAHVLRIITYVTGATPGGIPPSALPSVWDQAPPSTVYRPGCLLWQVSVSWRGKPGTISPPRLKKFWSTPAPTERWGAAKNTWPCANTWTVACRRPCLRDSVDVLLWMILCYIKTFPDVTF